MDGPGDDIAPPFVRDRQTAPDGLAAPRRWWLAVTVLAVAGGAWAAVSTWQNLLSVGTATLAALWTLPPLLVLHLLQLLLSAQAWRFLFRRRVPGLRLFFRLRVVREAIDSLLPVAQIGGEMVTAAQLARHGVGAGAAAASVVVDLTLEVISQLGFLLAGLVVLAAVLPGRRPWIGPWVSLVLLAAAAAIAMVLVQRLGGLRLIEALLGRIANRVPALAGAAVGGLHQAVRALYRRPAILVAAGLLHLLAWLLGTLESWLVLAALGAAVTPAQALVVESLGMAARSAGFAVPGALVVQDAGFMLAALAAGLPADAGLAVSLVKRLRELTVGLGGLALWRMVP